ncbi:GTPase [Ponticoccus sp. (in: a-proteobacteria)]|uniref:GTPase n=1 Tax=Ponticoccus sp. (in: a-proteobacteria) TaxID=1925025 RepID=UPI003AB62D8C
MPKANVVLKRITRSPAVLAVVIYALPWLALVVLGVLWLAEHDWLLPFVGITLGLTLLLRLALMLLRRLWRRWSTAPGDADHEPIVAPNPDWTERELAAFKSLCAGIAREPVPWSNLRQVAFDLVEEAAKHLSAGEKGALDFSIPEALLLADRVMIRMRRNLHDMVPFSDRISLKTLLWMWQNKAWAQRGATAAGWAWRAKRLVTNPPAAIIQEIQGIVTSGADGGEIRNFSVVIVQQVILEEVARAAVDLHSGHMRFTDEELLKIELGSAVLDKRILAQPDEPIRLLVIGQVSAGKSTVINQLAESTIAETDMAPTTPGLTRHVFDIDGLAYSVIDSQGIDGSDQVAQALLAQVLECDHILWIVRADRPARAPDVELLRMIETAFAARPLRRVPPMTIAANAVDQLLPDWPFPEHHLTNEAQTTVAAASSAICADLSCREAIPLVSEGSVWNHDQLRAAILNGASDALATQRNRRRMTGTQAGSSVSQELSRGASGIWQAGRLASGKLFGR